MSDPTDPTILAVGGQKLHQSDVSTLARWGPLVLGVMASGGLTFGATTTADQAELMAAARAEVRAEMELEQCQRDMVFWKDRAVSGGGGIE